MEVFALSSPIPVHLSRWEAIRISTAVYNTPAEINHFIGALHQLTRGT